jgi:hypothetical protein
MKWFPAYILTGNGVQGTHTLYRDISRTSAVQTMSIYAESGTNMRIQLAVGNFFSVHANFDLLNGTITAQDVANISATITLGPNGFYRCSMTFASNSGNLFILWLITSPTSGRSEKNSTAGSVIVVAPQLELSLSPTSYISRGIVSVIRVADVIRADLNLSAFRLYGSRDFTGASGRDGVDGAPGAPGRGGGDGVDGEPGALGRDGRDGVDDMDGAPGAHGQECRDGVDVATGPAGPAGP